MADTEIIVLVAGLRMKLVGCPSPIPGDFPGYIGPGGVIYQGPPDGPWGRLENVSEDEATRLAKTMYDGPYDPAMYLATYTHDEEPWRWVRLTQTWNGLSIGTLLCVNSITEDGYELERGDVVPKTHVELITLDAPQKVIDLGAAKGTDLIPTLLKYLESARKGEIEQIAIACIWKDDQYGYTVTGGDRLKILGCVDHMKHSMLSMYD